MEEMKGKSEGNGGKWRKWRGKVAKGKSEGNEGGKVKETKGKSEGNEGEKRWKLRGRSEKWGESEENEGKK